MAKRKSDLVMGNFSGVQITDLQSVMSQEKNILSGTLDKIVDIKNKSISRLSGAKTEVVYFHQVPSDKNNYLVNQSGFNSSDPNLVNYVCIEHFVVKMTDATSLDWSEQEGGGPKSGMFEGKFQILPNTILPLANDRFLMEYMERLCLFKVNDCTPLTADPETAYEISYNLEEDEFTYEGSELSTSVVDEYIFEQAHIGSEYRTIFRKNEYKHLLQLKILYNSIGSLYIETFYDKILNTFLLRYENNLVDDTVVDNENYIMITSSGSVSVPLHPAKDNPEFKNSFSGRSMYDSELIEFIKKNRIFDDIGNKTLYPTQYATNKSLSVYNKTLFYALETQDRHKFKNRYFLPIELNIATPAAQPILFSKINLLHVPVQNDSTLSLYPITLYDRVMNTLSDNINVFDFKENNVFDRFSYIIALYLNRYNTSLLNYLLYLYSKLDIINDFESIILKNEAFYLFPIIGYIVKEVASNLSKVEVSKNYFDFSKEYLPS
jgi:hypothetical protein